MQFASYLLFGWHCVSAVLTDVLKKTMAQDELGTMAEVNSIETRSSLEEFQTVNYAQNQDLKQVLSSGTQLKILLYTLHHHFYLL